jgi:hypothetical protein
MFRWQPWDLTVEALYRLRRPSGWPQHPSNRTWFMPDGSGRLWASYRLLRRSKRAPGPFIITTTSGRVCRTYWQLNANQLSSDNGAKSLEAERDEELKAI